MKNTARGATRDFPVHVERIRERRKAVRLSQTELGRMLGITYQQIQKYEHGDNLPNAVVAVRMAKVLNTTVEYLWGDV